MNIQKLPHIFLGLVVVALMPGLSEGCRPRAGSPSAAQLAASEADAVMPPATIELANLCEKFDSFSAPVQSGFHAVLDPFVKSDGDTCEVLLAQAVAAEALYLQINGPTDLAVLAQMKNLTSLKLELSTVWPKGLQSLAALPKFHQLQFVGTSSKKFPQLIPEVSTLSQLTDLGILAVPTASVKGLGGLTNLTKLNLSSMNLKDADDLKTLTNLELLSVEDNKLTSLGFIAGMLSLETLYARKNQIKDVTPVMNTAQIQTLRLSDNPGISNITAVKFLPALVNLEVSACAIANLEALSKSAQLKVLRVSNNPIVDLTPLANLPIESLDVSYAKIKSLDVVTTMPKLRIVEAHNNALALFPALPAASPIETLTLTMTDAKNYCALANAAALAKVITDDGAFDHASFNKHYNCAAAP